MKKTLSDKKWSVSTLEDLTNLVTHNTRVFACRIDRLARRTRNLKILGAISALGVVYAVTTCRKQKEVIDSLSIRLSKLENKEE